MSRTSGLRVYAGGKMSSGPWTYDILRKLVAAVKYKPGWTMEIVEEDGALRLVITDMKCVDAYGSRGSMQLSHYHPVPQATYNEKTWKRWIFEQCRRVENHEIGEWLRWGDERPFAPLHGPGEDPYTVHEFREEVDAFTIQDGSVRGGGLMEKEVPLQRHGATTGTDAREAERPHRTRQASGPIALMARPAVLMGTISRLAFATALIANNKMVLRRLKGGVR